jgi:DNA gyrase subunit A
MAKKRQDAEKKPLNPNVVGLKAEILEQPITDTLEVNFMPYAMSVIMSRAIPEIDGFKPSHRKLLYTMYKMGLLTARGRSRPTSSARRCASIPTATQPSTTRWSGCQRDTKRF